MWPSTACAAARSTPLENEADRIVRRAPASLFAQGIDPMVVIRWKASRR